MVAIIDYDAGNLTSVKRALDYLNIASEITCDHASILNAERVIFPGVGHAKTAMGVLKNKGLDSAIRQVFHKGTPILGVCLGSQIVLSHSEEGDTECLGLIKGNCPRFKLSDPLLKIPHMGWNSVRVVQKHFLLKDIKPGDELYFVHSYYTRPVSDNNIYAESVHEITIPVAIGEKNLFATQFHPEKSGPVGLQILKNFAAWDGSDAQ